MKKYNFFCFAKMIKCFRCGGTGTMGKGETCYWCNGKGVVPEDK